MKLTKKWRYLFLVPVSMFAKIFTSLRFLLTCLLRCCTRAQESGLSVRNCFFKEYCANQQCRVPNCFYFTLRRWSNCRKVRKNLIMILRASDINDHDCAKQLISNWHMSLAWKFISLKCCFREKIPLDFLLPKYFVTFVPRYILIRPKKKTIWKKRSLWYIHWRILSIRVN